MSRIKEILVRQAERTNSTRALIIALIGLYFGYMAYRMLDNTKNGFSSMSLRLTIVLMSLMILAGLAVFAYGVFLFCAAWKRYKQTIPDDTKKRRGVKMKVYSVYDIEFAPYGKVLDGYDTAELIEAMNAIELPADGVNYEPGIASLEACSIFSDLRDRAYGGMPIELGMCWGRNTKLNCLEYHKDSEVNIGANDFILLVAREDEIKDGVLDTAAVKAFLAPAGAAVEVYATTLHYAPCHTDISTGFRTAIVLPRGTNTAMPEISVKNLEDKCLWARNKWLLAHEESSEAKSGAYIGLSGVNIDIA